MYRLFLEPVLQVSVVVPFILFLLRERTRINFQRVFLFVTCYVIYQLFLVLPGIIPALDFMQSAWNWEGKIYGIVWAVIAWRLCRSSFGDNNFFRVEQDRKGFRVAVIAALSIVVLSAIVWYVFGSSDLSYEALLFQISLPGIDEELMFRGVLLGLLVSSLQENVPFLGNPAVFLTAVLFGLMHALTLDKNCSVAFDPVYFAQTGFAGYVWGWITLKSRSILLAILSHNLSNFFGTLVTMI